MQKKIDQFEIRKKREFGEIIGDAFSFLRLYFKEIGMSVLKYVLPFVLLGTFLQGYYFADWAVVLATGSEEYFTLQKLTYMFLMVVASIFGVVLIYTTIYGAFDLHLDEVEVNESAIGGYLLRHWTRVITSWFILILIFATPIMILAFLRSAWVQQDWH